MGGERSRNSCRERLALLAEAELDAEQARRAAIEMLRRAVGFERWCWPLTDPDSGLATGGIGEVDFWPSLARLVALEQHGDLTSKTSLVVGERTSVALSQVTRGDLARSRRWRECLRPYGIGDELMTACRDRHGCWGSVELLRDAGDRPFAEEDVRLLADVASLLGRLVRRSLLRSWHGQEGDDVPPPPPATLILDSELRAASWTPSLQQWLTALPGAGAEALPPAVHEIGARVLAPPAAMRGLVNRVRVRTRTAGWAVLEGGPLEGAARGGVAITIRPASSAEVFDVLCKTCELTPRERELVALLARGMATTDVARRLSISRHTVQDHLKAIFSKAAVRSRRELISRLAGTRAGRPVSGE